MDIEDKHEAMFSDAEQLVEMLLKAFSVRDRAAPLSAGSTLRALAQIATALGARMKRLEEIRSLPFRGVWREETSYLPGDFCMHRGSMYHAASASKGIRPSDHDAAWQMCVKAGRDGRDGKDANADARHERSNGSHRVVQAVSE